MIFTPNQIQELVSIVDSQHILFAAKTLGPEVLSEKDKEVLKDHGIEFEDLESNKSIETALQFGMISQSLSKPTVKAMKWPEFKRWVQSGGHIPLTTQEKQIVSVLKQKTYTHIKGLGNRISNDLTHEIIEASQVQRTKTEKLIKKELTQGVLDRQSVQQIVSNLGHKTGDWQRDWARITETEMQNAFEEGRAAMIKRQNEGKDPLVFKDVFLGACKHCIRLYLTHGIGSKPKIFKLSELEANGTNIGLKVDQWKPTISATHPFCFTNSRTRIYTSKGWVQIKDIKVGDLVLTHKGRFRKVTELVFTEREVPSKFIITCKMKREGRTIELRDITGEHPVLVNGNWIKVKDIKIGQKLHLLHDKCSYEECNKPYPIFYRDSVDHCKVDHCSVSCKSFDKSKNRTEEERQKFTANGRKSCSEKYPNAEHLHTSEVVNKILSKMGSPRFVSYIELKLRYFLDQLKVDYKVGYRIPAIKKDPLDRQRYFYPDIYIESLNIVIEADGIAWHDAEIDKRRDVEIKESIGADTFRFKERDIRKNGKEVFEELERIVKNHRGEYSFKHIEVIKIEEILYAPGSRKLYNFSVEEDESYIANGMVVHNCRCMIGDVDPDYEWDEETKSFSKLKPPEQREKKVVRERVRVKIGDKEFLV